LVWGEGGTSNVFEVSRSTLKYKVNSKERDIKKLSNIRLGRKPVMPYNLAEDLVTYCLMMERKFFRLTRSIKRMAFELDIKNGLARSLSVQQGRAGWKWLRNFMCRHPRLRLRKSQVTSAARVNEFTKINVEKFVDVFEPVLGNFSSHRLFIYEDTGLIVVQHKVCEVISLKGKRGFLSSAQRGSLVTNATCMNATVTYVSLLLVFPRSNMNANSWTALHQVQ